MWQTLHVLEAESKSKLKFKPPSPCSLLLIVQQLCPQIRPCLDLFLDFVEAAHCSFEEALLGLLDLLEPLEEAVDHLGVVGFVWWLFYGTN